jgi:diguanylate cyclase (GGDEF)-like protein
LAPPASSSPERFVTEVSAELSAETIRNRWQHVNVILRLSMLTGLPMQLEATLNLLCDMAAEIVSYDKAIVSFWDESQEQMHARIVRGFPDSALARQETSPTNVLNLWTVKHSRPLLVSRLRMGTALPSSLPANEAQVEALLDFAGAASALSVPLFVTDKVRGSLQLFSSAAKAFSQEDAQLLWVFALVAENLLTREYSSESLMRFAFTDYLTGLRTRGYFEQQLDLEFKRAERRRQKFALLMIDIDHFKRLNDTYGHHVGDQVLREVASILVKDMREVDTVARYGGEEFVIVLPETSETAALYVSERLRRAVEQAKFFTGSPHPIQHLTISVGVAVYDRDARFKRDLIESSDAALYAAKHEGRNRTISYSELAQREKKRAS